MIMSMAIFSTTDLRLLKLCNFDSTRYSCMFECPFSNVMHHMDVTHEQMSRELVMHHAIYT